jgi:hypothetical protein
MKIVLDRRVCEVWDAACEADFADKFLGEEVLPTACTVMLVEDDNSDVLTFHIRDRDESEKQLVINDDNIASAIDSWLTAYKEQQAKKDIILVDQVE